MLTYGAREKAAMMKAAKVTTILSSISTSLFHYVSCRFVFGTHNDSTEQNVFHCEKEMLFISKLSVKQAMLEQEYRKRYWKRKKYFMF